jgi:hypothetical protein
MRLECDRNRLAAALYDALPLVALAEVWGVEDPDAEGLAVL